MACVAFFSLLRSSEFTATRKHVWDPSTDLRIYDVFQEISGKITLRIKSSKTDPFQVGCEIELVRLANKFFSATNLLSYLAGPYFPLGFFLPGPE